MRVCSGHRGRVRLYQARVCERSVNAGTLVSPRGGDRSSVWETQEENACTRQPQAAEESRRSGELARRAPARAPAPSPLPPAVLRRVLPLPAGRAAGALGGAGSLLPGRGGARGAGAPCLPEDGRGSAALGWAAPGWSGLRALPPRGSAAPACSAPPGSAPPGGARGARWRPTRRGVGAGRAGGRAPAAGAALGRPAAAWKLLIWAVMSGEVAGAGPPTSFHSLPRVSCRRARGTPAPARGASPAVSAPAYPASLPAAWGPRAAGSRRAGGRRQGSASGESPAPGGRREGLRSGLRGDRPCHSGRRPSLRARPGSRAVISSRALREGQSGKPRSLPPPPPRGAPSLQQPIRRASIVVPRVRGPRLALVCQPRSGKPAPPKAGIYLQERWAGQAWPGSLGSSLRVRVGPPRGSPTA